MSTQPFAVPPLSTMLAPGSVIGQKYRLEQRLGAGGMGEVFQAFHLQLGHRVAIKVLRGHGALDPALRGRFLREAMAAAQLRSDHIAQVFDLGQLDDGSPYMVMELLQGMDLATLQAQRGTLGVVEVIGLLRQVCAALAVAHAAGVVHRDLKPANLFLVARADGGFVLKVLDFGIAKAPQLVPSARTLITDEAPVSVDSLTQTSALLGSVRYMAPEQVASARDVDARADLWSLGVVGYKLLTNRYPFEGESLPELIYAMARTRPVPLTHLRPDVPPALADLIDRCLMPSPDHRWPSAAMVHGHLAALQSWASMPGGASVSLPPGVLSTTVSPVSAWTASAAPVRAPSSSRLVWAALAGVLGLGMLGSLLALRALSSAPSSAQVAGGAAPAPEVRVVDPIGWLPHARLKAKELDPDPKLAVLSVHGLHRGEADLSDGAVVTYMFLNSQPRKKSITVSISKFMEGAAMGDSTDLTPVPEPRCTISQLWKAALGAGMDPEGSYELMYTGAPLKWIMVDSDSHDRRLLSFDPQTCRVAKTYQ